MILFSISDLENLVELDLSFNFLSSVPIGALGQLRNLKFLNLGSNRIQVTAIVNYIKNYLNTLFQMKS